LVAGELVGSIQLAEYDPDPNLSFFEITFRSRRTSIDVFDRLLNPTPEEVERVLEEETPRGEQPIGL
jgi:hypothetical protein